MRTMDSLTGSKAQAHGDSSRVVKNPGDTVEA